MQVIDAAITFQVTRGTGPVQLRRLVQFDAPVSSAVAILTGFRASYVSDDHHLGNLDIRLDTDREDDRLVAIMVTFGLRDWSGSWDDRYDGRVEFTVIGV
jgi:hypothetical protein